ncbi:hypothetical protein EMUR_01335 [Ehrlichia muris AS145]|uniref:Uncharacterized protein n=1 Tax=Ehrlichia muris AS145 TaxID=1423892 RepID=V9R789_9RICK|nr:hypothetical protein EMUR_01335 [Ehrlichia muris AS145]
MLCVIKRIYWFLLFDTEDNNFDMLVFFVSIN